jgi:hypothetical protein
MEDEGETPLLTIYRQMDGYPSGMGADLVAFLRDRHIVNGYDASTPAVASNGMGCLAASLVATLKDGIGNIYVYLAGSRDCDEEYVYTIYPKGDRAYLRAQTVGPKGYADETLFDGLPEAWNAAD